MLDYNGTLACDGELLCGVKQALEALADHVRIHVVTADTFGRAEAELADVPGELVVLPTVDQAAGKRAYVERLGCDRTVCIGNGRNDRRMLQEAVLAIALVQREGAAPEALAAADVVCTDVLSALELLCNPLRLTATLRS